MKNIVLLLHEAIFSITLSYIQHYIKLYNLEAISAIASSCYNGNLLSS